MDSGAQPKLEPTTGSNMGAAYLYNETDQTTAIQPRADQGAAIAGIVYGGTGQSERALATGGGLLTELEDPCLPGAGCVDSPGTAQTTWTHTNLGVTGESTAGLTTTWVRDPTGGLLAQKGLQGTHYYLTDGQGSVVGLTDATGDVAAEYAYDPFGNTIENTNPEIANPWRYASYYLDPTGLYKAGERYYNPDIGRWTQPDPIWDPLDPQLWNRYVYVGNDPINYTDPNGTDACSNSRGGLWEFFDHAWDVVSNTVLAGGLLWGGLKLAGMVLTAATPVTSTIALFASVASFAIAGYPLYRAAKSYIQLQSC